MLNNVGLIVQVAVGLAVVGLYVALLARVSAINTKINRMSRIQKTADDDLRRKVVVLLARRPNAEQAAAIVTRLEDSINGKDVFLAGIDVYDATGELLIRVPRETGVPRETISRQPDHDDYFDPSVPDVMGEE